MVTCTSRIRVRYADTDQMGIVHHAKFLEYFEIARSDLLRSLGMGYSDVEKNGFYLPVLEVCVQFKRPAFYDDLLIIESAMREKPSNKMKIEYTVKREGEDIILAGGYTMHGFISKVTRRPVRAPEFFKSLIEKYF